VKHAALLAAATLTAVAAVLSPAATARPKRPAAPTPATAVVTWNKIAVATVRNPPSGPGAKFQTEGLIYMSYVQAAVYDAVAKITGRYVPYHDFAASTAGASPEAAVGAAARTALNYYFASQAAATDTQYNDFLATLPNAGKVSGIAVGEAAANDIIAFRADDGRNAPTITYGAPAPAGGRLLPGAWEVATTAQTPWVAVMRPFMLESALQFRADPPPALGSSKYAQDLNEVKTFGAVGSSARTADQTATAYFWNANVISQYNRAIQDVVGQHSLDIAAAARLFAMGNMVTTDAAIACFDSKYYYLLWRPVNAIRNADRDGNAATTADPAWSPLLTTPNHPEYPSAHGCVTSALTDVLAKALHTNRIDVTFMGATNGSSSLDTPRHFGTVGQVQSQIVDARVWIGFHYRSSVVAGLELGNAVAGWTLKRYFAPVNGGEDQGDSGNRQG
jgi:hypothetical protein